MSYVSKLEELVTHYLRAALFYCSAPAVAGQAGQYISLGGYRVHVCCRSGR